MAKTPTSTKSSAKMTTGTTTAGNKRRPARGGSGAERTGLQNAESGFRASPELSRNLQSVLVDLVELQIQGKQAHWNIVGTNFRDTHLQLDEIVHAARKLGVHLAKQELVGPGRPGFAGGPDKDVDVQQGFALPRAVSELIADHVLMGGFA